MWYNDNRGIMYKVCGGFYKGGLPIECKYADCPKCPIRFKCYTQRGGIWITYKELQELCKERVG